MPPQDRVQQHAAGDDEVGAARIEPRQLHALGNAAAGHFFPQTMDLLGWNTQVSDLVARAAPLGGGDRAEAEDRSRCADHPIESGRADVAEVLRQLLVDVADELSLVTAGQRIAVDETLGEPNDAELEAFCCTKRCPGPVRDFDAAAADVHDHGRRTCNIDAVDGSEMNQPGFLSS